MLVCKLLGALSSVLLEEGQLKIHLKSKGKQLFQQEVSLKYLCIFKQNCIQLIMFRYADIVVLLWL